MAKSKVLKQLFKTRNFEREKIRGEKLQGGQIFLFIPNFFQNSEGNFLKTNFSVLLT